MLAQLPANFAAGFLDVLELGARARTHDAGDLVDVLDFVEAAHVEHRASTQRHRLPIVARARAARRDRHLVFQSR